MRHSTRFLPVLVVVAVSTSVGLMRGTGLLQEAELKYLDFLFQLRPQESPDERFVIVEHTEADIAERREVILSDATLVDLINKIQAQNPRLVGLDIFRDQPQSQWGTPVEEAQTDLEQLESLFQQSDNLYVIASQSGPEDLRIYPPPEVPESRVGDAAAVIDRDGVMRRSLLYVCSKKDRYDNCQEWLATLPTLLSFEYLHQEGVEFTRNAPASWFNSEQKDWFQWGETVFPQLYSSSGGYADLATGNGAQVLINWRTPPNSFKKVTVGEVLSDQIPPDLFADKIVLIGSTAESKKDLKRTPYSSSVVRGEDEIYGVETIANITSHIISAGLEERRNIWTLPDLGEYMLIPIWGFLGVSTIACWHRYRQERSLMAVKVVVVTILYSSLAFGISYGAFLSAVWIPFIPYALTITFGVAIVELLLLDKDRIEDKRKNEETNRKIEKELNQRHERIVIQEKVNTKSYMGTKIAHVVEALNTMDRAVLKSLRECRDLLRICWDLKEAKTLMRTLIEVDSEIIDAQKRMNEVIREIENDENKPKAIKLVDLIEELVLNLELKLKENQVKVEVVERRYEFTGTVEILSKNLKQALEALFDNSLNAVHKKQEEIEGYQPYLEVAIVDCGNEVEIKISDNGNGFGSPFFVNDLFFTQSSQNIEPNNIDKTYEAVVELHKGRLSSEIQSPTLRTVVVRIPKRFRANR